jgi:hypothetical protein
MSLVASLAFHFCFPPPPIRILKLSIVLLQTTIQAVSSKTWLQDFLIERNMHPWFFSWEALVPAKASLQTS